MRAFVKEGLYVLVPFALAFGVVVATRLEAPKRENTESTARATEVVDSTGRRAPIRRYSRIASSSLAVDRTLLELVEPSRVVGYSQHGFENSVAAYRFGDKARINPGSNLESLLELRPDLLLVNDFVDPARVRRLEDAGVVVFDLGRMGGVSSLVEDIRLLGTLLDESERGERIAHAFEQRMARVAVGIPEESRPSALYVGIHGSQLFGGARHTSYHDVLEAAGLVDIASARYVGWPAYTAEDLLGLDPTMIVTTRGQGAGLCRLVGLETLRACKRPGAIVEVDTPLLLDPGLTMLEAAEALREAVHGGAP